MFLSVSLRQNGGGLDLPFKAFVGSACSLCCIYSVSSHSVKVSGVSEMDIMFVSCNILASQPRFS